MPYQKNLVVLFEEFENYLQEETVCSLAIEGIKPDFNSLYAKNYYETAKNLYSLALKGVPLSSGLVLFAFEKLWEGFNVEPEYRKTDMIVIGAKFEPPPPERVPYLMDRLFEYYLSSKAKPVSMATRFHILFEVIHPFFDGNGRLGRILLNYILIQNNLLNIAFRDRNSYIKALKDDEDPAIWIIEKLRYGRKITADDIDKVFADYSKGSLEKLVREEMINSLKIYTRLNEVYVSTDLACEIIGCKNKDYIRVLINRGKITGRKEGNIWTVSLASLIDYYRPFNIEEILNKFKQIIEEE